MKLLEIFKKAKIIQEEYNSYVLDKSFPISLDNLKVVVERYSELAIEVYSVNYKMNRIYGRMERKNKGARIDVWSGLNLCWTRYVYAKELSHLIIDTEDSFTKNYSELVAGLVDETFQESAHEENIQSEYNSHLVACELLLPYSMRQAYLNQVDAEDITFYKVAVKHRTPEAIVEQIIYQPSIDYFRPIMAALEEEDEPLPNTQPS